MQQGCFFFSPPNSFSYTPETTQGAQRLQELRQHWCDERMEKEKPPQWRRLLAPGAVVCHPLPFRAYTRVPCNHVGNEKQLILNSTTWGRTPPKLCQQNSKFLISRCIFYSEMKVMRKQAQVSKEPCGKRERENGRHVQKHPWPQRLPLARGWAWTPQHTAGGTA